MNVIHIEYRGRRRVFRAPAGWNELTRKQLFEWCGIARQAIDVERAMDAAVMLLYGIPVFLLCRLMPVQRLHLADTLAFLGGENRLTTNVIGRLRLLGRAYHGPAGRLANVTIGEYRRTELYYQLWLKTGDSQLLRLLAATLFRPARHRCELRDEGDDIREPINERRIVRRAALFRLLHPNWLHAVLFYYEGCRRALVRKFPRVFVKGGDGGEKGSAWKLVDLDDYVLGYSGDKLGTYEETKGVNVFVFFRHMTQRMEEYDRLQRKGDK